MAEHFVDPLYNCVRVCVRACVHAGGLACVCAHMSIIASSLGLLIATSLSSLMCHTISSIEIVAGVHL